MSNDRSIDERRAPRAHGQDSDVEVSEHVQDLLCGLALNVLTALGRIDPGIYVDDEGPNRLRLGPGLKPLDEERWVLLQKAFASVIGHPEASEALARGVAKARALVDGGQSSTTYDVKIDALSTHEDGEPFYRFRVVGEGTPELAHWHEVFMLQYAPKTRQGRKSWRSPIMMDRRSGLMFTTASVVCHPFAEAKKDLIESWIDDCCKFNGKHGKVVRDGANKMKCQI